MTDSIGELYLDSVRHRFRVHKKLGDAALEQLSNEQLIHAPGQASNSIAVILQHLHGNMLSRWTDFLTTDGEKPTRRRDAEFVLDPSLSRDERLRRWNEGWRCLLDAVDSLEPEDLEKSITIRGQSLGVLDAVERQVFHVAYHVGQILYVARMMKGDEWKYLSIPPGESGQYKPGRRD